MKTDCLQFELTDEERAAFEKDGFFVLDQVLATSQVEGLTAVADKLAAEAQREGGLGSDARLDVRDLLWRDPLLLDLIDCPMTLPKVWGVLGWNIQIYHTLYMHSPPDSREEEIPFYSWHRDSGRLNGDLALAQAPSQPQPMISMKVAFFLTDCSQEGRANFWAVPGSHVKEIDRPQDGSAPEGAQPVLVPAGGAVLFDRRLVHASSSNSSDITRKVLFYGYSYRWLRPRDDQTVEQLFDRCDPIRRQLLGYSANGGYGYTSPTNEDAPLRGWLEENAKS